MTVIQFKEFIPDAADFGNPGSIEIKNAMPGLNSYQPLNSLVSVSDALDAYPRGAIEATDANENVFQYAGNETKLYSLSGSTWADVSLAPYTTATEENWEFVRWKEKIIATNFTDSPQEITFGGANFANLTTDLRFRHVAVIRDFVVAGYTWDAVDGTVRDRVRWSAINDETDWTVSATTLSDFRDLNTGGGIQQVVGGEYGVALAEKSVWRMTFVGSPTVFQIDEVMPGVGALAKGAVLGDTVFFPSDHGFIALQGGTSPTFIGSGRVDKFFRNDVDENYLYRISAVADPRSGRVYWAYPGAGNTNGRPNKILAYDRILNKWGYAEQELELIWNAGGVATTLEDLDSFSTDIDAMTVSFDSSQWKGGSTLLSAFDASFTKANFSGLPMTATFLTRENELNSGHRTRLNAFFPVIDGGTVTARVGTRNTQTDDVTFSPSMSPTSTGRFTTRANAKYHRFELTASGDWGEAIGVDVNKKDARRAEARG